MNMENLNDFDRAIICLIDGDGLSEALCMNFLTGEQRERFDKIKSIYLEECLKDCDF